MRLIGTKSETKKPPAGRLGLHTVLMVTDSTLRFSLWVGRAPNILGEGEEGGLEKWRVGILRGRTKIVGIVWIFGASNMFSYH